MELVSTNDYEQVVLRPEENPTMGGRRTMSSQDLETITVDGEGIDNLFNEGEDVPNFYINVL